MMDCVQGARGPRFPRLVSFIGETGAGKSSLIRLLIGPTKQLDTTDSPPVAAPIIGRASCDIPTSSDVHLYLDPHTRYDTHPILFADCEGFKGGESTVAGNNLESSDEQAPTAAVSERDSNMLKKWSARSKKRVLRWAQRDTPGSEEMSKRTFVVKHLYPQVFYSFSDVVVFVLTQAKTLEAVVEDLLAWADKNYKGTTNLPSKPHVIIAINKCESATPPDQWKPSNATAHLLSTATSQVRRNITFAKYANIWENSGIEIDDMKQLLRRYYSSVNVVRIPQKSRYQLLNEQRNRLYELVLDNCNKSTEAKLQKRMLPDVDEFETLLSLAFDHFAEGLDIPFDFMKASLSTSPPPETFTASIYKFVVMVGRERHLDGDVRALFNLVTPIVATCILLDSSRNRRMGNPRAWFSAVGEDAKSYASMCEELVMDYFNTYVRCAFEIKDPLFQNKYHRCDLRRKTHGDAHSHSSGWTYTYNYRGDFKSDFDPHKFAWSHQVVEAIAKLQSSDGRQDCIGNRHEWIEGHRDCVRRVFKDFGGAQLFRSHAICLCCLSNPPQHHLPCEHVICTLCATDFGRCDELNQVIIEECPLCDYSETALNWSSVVIRRPPPFSGQRILVLDGGGVRGIVELRVLEALENKLHVPIQRFFDLLVGTSTGGIIALALGDQYMPIKDCIVAFESLVQAAFTPRTGQKAQFIEQVQKYVNRSMYETKPLEEALKRVFTPERPLFGRRQFPGTNSLNVAVIAASSTGAQGYILSNYNTKTSPRIARCHRYRPDFSDNELRVWEAARSTSAAIGFFKPYKRDSRLSQPPEFTDGGLFQNNPVQVALEESRSLAKTSNQVPMPDILFSVGTGLPKSYVTKAKEPVSDIQSSQMPWFRVLFSVVRFQIQMNLDAQKRWHEQVESEPELRNRMFRINPYLGSEPPEMDDRDCVPQLSKIVAYDLQNNDELRNNVRQVASVLAASSFYFDLQSVRPERTGTLRLSGTIKCRFHKDVSDVKGLGKFLSVCVSSFLIQSIPQLGKDQELKVPTQVMAQHGFFEGMDVVIEVLGEEVESKISLKLPGMTTTGQLFPISGFPRCLFREDASKLSRQTYDHPPEYTVGNEGSLSLHITKSQESVPTLERLRLETEPEEISIVSLSVAESKGDRSTR